MGRRCASLVRMGRGSSGGARRKGMGRMIARVHMHSGGFGGFRAAGLSRGMQHGAAARRSVELHVARLEAGALHGVDVSARPHAVFLIVEVSCLAFLIVEVSQPQGGARRALASPGSAATSSRASRSAIAVRRGGCFVRAGCTGARRRRRRVQMKNSRGSSGRLTGTHVEERLPGARGWVPARHACFFDDDAGR